MRTTFDVDALILSELITLHERERQSIGVTISDTEALFVP